MHTRLIAPLLLAVIGTACTATPKEAAAIADRKAADEVKLARLLKGYEPGPPQECIDQNYRNFHTTAVGSTILYRDGNSPVIYRNDTEGCEGIERGDAQILRRYETQLCRGQIIQTYDAISRNPTGGCALNAFIPYRKVQP